MRTISRIISAEMNTFSRMRISALGNNVQITFQWIVLLVL